MARVALLLGGNQGDVKRTLQTAQQLVNSRVGAVLRCSHRYESEPWGFPAAERFSNQALEVSTDLTPHEVLDACQRIERELGRNRAAEAVEKASSGAVYCSRPIDIDIIFYDDEVIGDERLTVPHPLLAEREFALVPLCEIMRQRRHPVTGATARCSTRSETNRTGMKAKRILPLLAAAALLAGCFKDVSYKTNYVLKPLAQAQTVDPVEPFEGLKAYAFDADTAFYTVASYEDALNGVIARKDDLSDRIASPVAAAEPCVREGTVGWVQMPLSAETQMVVAVDPVNRVYAYTQQELDVNLPNLYVSLIFKPWKGFSYKEGNWSFYNEFYAPPVYLDCLIDPSVQLAEGGETSEIANVKAYAYAADTTAFYIASYDDAVSGKLTAKTAGVTPPATPFSAYEDKETGLYKMEVSSSTLMVVVVDRTNRLYAYSKQVVDLEGETVTLPVVFRPWRATWIYVEDGWRFVDASRAPETKPQTQSRRR